MTNWRYSRRNLKYKRTRTTLGKASWAPDYSHSTSRAKASWTWASQKILRTSVTCQRWRPLLSTAAVTSSTSHAFAEHSTSRTTCLNLMSTKAKYSTRSRATFTHLSTSHLPSLTRNDPDALKLWGSALLTRTCCRSRPTDPTLIASSARNWSPSSSHVQICIDSLVWRH